MDVNGSTSAFTSMLAGSSSFTSSPNVSYVIEAVATTSAWTWIFTVLALCVVYDQSMFSLARAWLSVIGLYVSSQSATL
jgi:sterol 22-desaturase